jgi:ligand-binding SRPBCC domain-containing protein
MTVLDNSIHIGAPPEKVWSVLAALDQLQHYDPVVVRSRVIGSREGLGAERQCDLSPRGRYKERVTAWEPEKALSFELFECTLPVRTLKHHYRLEPEGDGTRVTQRMEYRLKLGPIGVLMDVLLLRRKWDSGIKGFFAGLKHYVETGERPPGKR